MEGGKKGKVVEEVKSDLLSRLLYFKAVALSQICWTELVSDSNYNLNVLVHM